MNAGKTFEIRRIFNSDSSHGYFVMNIDLAMLTVNEMPVDVRTAVGPLPDFAIITIGSLVVLFWRVRAALSYVPISRVNLYGHQYIRIGLIISNRNQSRKLKRNHDLSLRHFKKCGNKPIGRLY